MKKTISIFLLIMCAALWAGCDREVNNWEVDPSADGLFRPLTFEENNLTATAVEIAYTQVSNATHYVFEFSKDSLLFNDIVRRDTILRDTLTVFADNTSSMKVEFHTWFTKLDGETKYSVRMKAISKTSGKESGYSSFFFQTPGEQLFTDAVPELSQVKLSWTPGEEVDRIQLLAKNQTGSAYGDPVDYVVTADEAQAGEKLITDLQMGTAYMAYIYKGEKRRGNISFRTSGLLNSETVEVGTDMDGGDLQNRLQELVDAGKSTVSLVFSTGNYHIDKLKVPAGIQNLALVGTNGPVGTDINVLPVVELKQVEMQGQDANGLGTVTYLSMENLNLTGTGEALFYMKEGSASTINFSGCYVNNYQTLINLKNGGKTYEAFSLDNCILSGCQTLVDNTGGDQAAVNKISMSKCTLKECGTWINSKKKGLQSISIDKCTVYNHAYGVTNMFRFDAQPASVVVTNTILSGDNAGQPFGMYKNYDYIDFSSCYITKDLTQGKYGFTNIVQYAGFTEELFVNAAQGDFHIRAIANFNGKKEAGDPRWGVETTASAAE